MPPKPAQKPIHICTYQGVRCYPDYIVHRENCETMKGMSMNDRQKHYYNLHKHENYRDPEKQRIYYEANKDRLNQNRASIVQCSSCAKQFKRSYIYQHIRTQYHRATLANPDDDDSQFETVPSDGSI